MLVQLRVRDLGVIEDLSLTFGSGMTALTGETGAGKTLVIEALELLMGGRADPGLVRAGSELAVVEGRFLDGEKETVLVREVPSDGRSRGYVDGRMATAGALADVGAGLVDLHGQHAHQSLLRLSTQRASLDRYAGVTTAEVQAAEAVVSSLEARLAELGGDERLLAREVDLLTHQLLELEAAGLKEPDEDERLSEEEVALASLTALREAAAATRGLIGADEGAHDEVAQGAAQLSAYGLVSDLAARLEAVAAELDDVVGELRAREDSFEDDPDRLQAVRERRQLLSELRRKYGASLAEVIEFRESTRSRLDDLQAGETRRQQLSAELDEALAELAQREELLGEARRRAAPELAREIEERLRLLSLPRARIEIAVPATGRGDAIEFRFGANVGEALLPLGKVVSGGELARAMLATRLVLTEAPPTLVFDEVDAGIGGEAALYVGRALGELGERHQVIVVTHLAQVAAFATSQAAVTKYESKGRTVTSAVTVDGEERLAELSRMLSGQPDSNTARRHAVELLQLAADGSTGSGSSSVSLSERTPGRTA